MSRLCEMALADLERSSKRLGLEPTEAHRMAWEPAWCSGYLEAFKEASCDPHGFVERAEQLILEAAAEAEKRH